MNDKFKAIVNIPGWMMELDERPKLDTTALAYSRVPVIYRAVNMRCDSLSSVPVRFYSGENELTDWWKYSMGVDHVLWLTQAAILLWGSCYWLKVRQGRRIVDLQWLNPLTMEVKLQPDRRLVFVQSVGASVQTFQQDDIIFVSAFDPQNDLGGLSATRVALINAGLMNYITEFANKFFEGGAMPVTVLGMPENTRSDEVKRIEGFFSRMMAGIKNAFRVLGMKGSITAQVLTPPIKDMVMPELSTEARRNIAAAYGIPTSMLDNNENYGAAAKEFRLSFWQDTVRPAAGLIQTAFQRQLFDMFGVQFKLAFEEMDIFQEEEKDRAVSLSSLTGAGVPLPVAMRILGYDLSSDDWAIIESESAEEEREEPQPEEQPDENIEEMPDESAMAKSELATWKKYEIKHAGKKRRAFAAQYIPASMQGAIEGWMEKAEDPDSVKRVFDSLREVYP